jgi:hypothetical protein
MTRNGLVAQCQKAELLGHQLLVAELSGGKWEAWIEGKKAVLRGTPGTEFADEREAKRIIHLLAHQHIAGSVCRCEEELVWELLTPRSQCADPTESLTDKDRPPVL